MKDLSTTGVGVTDKQRKRQGPVYLDKEEKEARRVSRSYELIQKAGYGNKRDVFYQLSGLVTSVKPP